MMDGASSHQSEPGEQPSQESYQSKIRFEILERKMENEGKIWQSKLQAMEQRAILAESECEKYKSAIISTEKELKEQVIASHQFELNAGQLEIQYDSLSRRLQTALFAENIEDAFSKIDRLFQSLDTLKRTQDDLLNTQLLLGAQKLKDASSPAHSKLPEVPQSSDMNYTALQEQIDEAISKSAALEGQIAKLQLENSELKQKNVALSQEIANCGSRLEESKREITQLSQEASALSASNQQFVSDNSSLRIEKAKLQGDQSKRLIMLQQISKRLDPSFLGLSRADKTANLLLPLSRLLESMTDEPIDTAKISAILAQSIDGISSLK